MASYTTGRSTVSPNSGCSFSKLEFPCASRSTVLPTFGLGFTELGVERKWGSLVFPSFGYGFIELAICRLWSFHKFDFSSRCKSMVSSSSGYGCAAFLRLPLLPFLLILLSAHLPLLSAADSSEVIEASSSYSDLELCESLVVKKTVINYGALHACIFNHSLAFSVPALLILVVLAFYILAQAAQYHFSPVVGRMAEMLHLSPSTGGVTLLALGNGAPDVFASIASVWGGNPRIGLSAIVSAGLFVTAFVVGFVALAASPFPLSPTTFLRDVCFYILAVTLMFLLYMSGEVYAWQALGLVFFYVFFVAVVFSMDHSRGKDRVLKTSISDLDSARVAARTEDVSKAYFSNGLDNSNVESLSRALDNHIIDVDCHNQGVDIEAGSLQYKPLKSHGQSLDVVGGIFQAKQPKDFFTVFGTLVCSLLCCGRTDSGRCKQSVKLQLVWQIPVEVMLRSTIPSVDPSKWNRIYASLNFVCCPLIILYIISAAVSPYWRMIFIVPGINIPLWLLVLLQGSVLGLAHYVFTKEPPRSELPLAIVTAFVMSVFWISFIAGELLGCLATLGKLLKLPPALLGLTVLAWGNSIGDLVADVAVARAGQPAMAMAGCFAGPMFNMLVGFGLALAMKASRMHPAPYLLEYNPSIVVAFGFLFVSLLGSLLVITWSRFQVPRYWGFCLIALYITFVVVSISNANVL